MLTSCNNSTENSESTNSVQNNELVEELQDDSSIDNTRSNDEDQKLYDLNVIVSDSPVDIEDKWVQSDGSLAPNKDFVITKPIQYNSKNRYKIQLTGYVSYYNKEKFIKSVRYSSNESQEIDSVNEANILKISYKLESVE